MISGAKRARTADLLHAIWRQHVHPRPSLQVTVLTRPCEAPASAPVAVLSCCTAGLPSGPTLMDVLRPNWAPTIDHALARPRS